MTIGGTLLLARGWPGYRSRSRTVCRCRRWRGSALWLNPTEYTALVRPARDRLGLGYGVCFGFEKVAAVVQNRKPLVFAKSAGGVVREDDTEADRSGLSDSVETHMGVWERVLTGGLGTAALGFGAYTVLRTGNQVGSAALVLVGAALVLIGVQGTPLVSFGSNAANVELARRRERVVAAKQVIEAAKTEPDPARASGLAEAAEIIQHESLDSLFPKAQRGLLYLIDVRHALRRVHGSDQLSSARFSRPYGDWLQLVDPAAPIVEIKYVSGGQYDQRILDATVSRAYERYEPTRLLIVTNMALPPRVSEIFSGTWGSMTVEVVTWNSRADDSVLGAALARASRPPSTHTP